MSNYELILGDCLDVMATLPAGSVDCICTDLPYGVTNCSWDAVIPFAPMWEQVKHVLKPRGVFVTTASQPFTSALVMSNLEWFKYAMVWDKKSVGNVYSANLRPLKSHEDICVFYEQQPVYNPQKTKGLPNHSHGIGDGRGKSIYGNPSRVAHDTSGMKFPKTILEFAKWSPRENLHPTQKPVALYDYLIRTYTNLGDTVLDFCCGSATTGVACIKTQRRFIGVELDPTYHAIAQRRLEDAAAQPLLWEAT